MDKNANLALVAAAPDLLVALKRVEWNGPRYRCPECLVPYVVGKHEKYCRLANAIAKAEGHS